MLNRFRKVLTPMAERLGSFLGSLGITPNMLTSLAVVLALATIPSGALGLYWLIPTLIITSSLLDWLDGAVARATSRVSKLGAFLDSVLDRISDISYLISFNYLGIDIRLILIAIPTSLLISYIRCRAESLGVSLEGIGVLERGERVVMMLVISVTSIVFSKVVGDYLLTLMVVLSTLTIIQRLAYVIKVLSGG
ncbi:MAG: CDP-alcohol phosphatidyltransferase family protein [Desulfurococcaceae archaeon]|nr:CDP-alcohol phosphatidyltransferase family protein [Desulfurococcaceae archaeon]